MYMSISAVGTINVPAVSPFPRVPAELEFEAVDDMLGRLALEFC
jgi:hypothetical protein